MIPCPYLVHPHELQDLLAFVPHHEGQVGRPVELGVGGNVLPLMVRVAVHQGGHLWELCNEVHRVLVRRLPVL